MNQQQLHQYLAQLKFASNLNTGTFSNTKEIDDASGVQIKNIQPQPIAFPYPLNSPTFWEKCPPCPHHQRVQCDVGNFQDQQIPISLLAQERDNFIQQKMQTHLRQLRNFNKKGNIPEEDKDLYEYIVHSLFLNSRQRYVRDIIYNSYVASSKGKPYSQRKLGEIVRMKPLSQKEKAKNYVIRGISCSGFYFPVGPEFHPETPFSPLPRYVIRDRQKNNPNVDLKQTLPVVKSVLSVSASLVVASHGYEFYSQFRNKYQKNRLINHNLQKHFIAIRAEHQNQMMSLFQSKIESLASLDEKEFYEFWKPPTFTHGIKIYRQPSILDSCKLHQHQIEGMSWLIHLYDHKTNCILADDVGLGKSLQIISFFAFLREQRHISGPHLIAMPGAVLATWKDEFSKWLPSANVVTYIGKKQARRHMFENIVFRSDFDVMLTTYSLLEVDKDLLTKIPWRVIVFDEGHMLKNSKSNMFKTIDESFYSEFRIIATATPFQNEIDELWSLLYLINPYEFCSLEIFHKFFRELNDLHDVDHELVMRRLHSVIRPYLLRRNKEELNFDIPNKLEITIKVSPTDLQKDILMNSLQGNPSMQKKLVLIRRVSNSPVLFLNRKTFNSIPIEYIIARTPKIRILDKILEKLIMTQHRFLIYSQWTSMMDLLQLFLNYKSYKCLRIDGYVKTNERIKMINEFIKPGSEYSGMLLSTRSSAFGLNLQVADTVILFDSDYNPFVELQASARVHRLGQTNIVVVIRLMTNETGEEKILRVSRKKFILGHQIIEAGKFNVNKNENESEAQLINDQSKVPEILDPTNEQLNSIIARSDGELGILQCSNRDCYYQEKEEYKDIDAEIMDKMDENVFEFADADSDFVDAE
ncbi:putative ATP-dependent DNA helicase CHR12 isoform X2 [Histomonas meleagridis]|uniref:putative ATP-dependent DNA helicase CHR12 isoform X2 n=1 Tax=Histomonas meleagridis TaxID=135588 RepID=UPI00355A8903|nr:putative ATP-dependent DNA helicase CHR12 isoform X2 [Histomonas meleagridis]KAH0798818.1 putative ATP-dependent DNA helicase CHR12 isoform X2 [Histomonas meleagridis]